MSSEQLTNENAFSGLKYYLITAIFYINIGVLFGGLNALRVAGIFNVIEIHDTHWTSTLIGGMTVLMLGEIYYIFSLHTKRDNWMDYSIYLVLLLFISATIVNYIRIWTKAPILQYFRYLVILGSLIFLIVAVIILLKNISSFQEHPSLIMLFFGVIWMAIAQLNFRGIVDPIFKIPYIYGFFSLTLFGSLNYLLPKLYKSSIRKAGTIWRDTILISLSAISLIIDELVEIQSLFGLLGSLFWGLVGFLFILYVFDLIFKNGMMPSLVGLSIALVMFGFFVFDTFMKALFKQWVEASHAHFMFLGTLLITIISLGTKIYGDQKFGDEESKEKEKSTLKLISIGFVILFVSLVLLGFVLQAIKTSYVAVAGYSGIGLFASIVFLELVYILQD